MHLTFDGCCLASRNKHSFILRDKIVNYVVTMRNFEENEFRSFENKFNKHEINAAVFEGIVTDFRM